MAAWGRFPMGLSAGLPVECNLHYFFFFLCGCALTHAYDPSVVTGTARAKFTSANLTRVYGLRLLQQMISKIIDTQLPSAEGQGTPATAAA